MTASNSEASRAASTHSSSPSDSQVILKFHPGDPENPVNWSKGRKAFVMWTGIATVVNSTLGSALPSGAIGYIAKYFDITSHAQLVLPISMYLIGYIVGPLLCGPLSETYGRRVIMISTFAIFTAFSLGCALAPTWPVFLFFRFMCGVSASSPISVVPGCFADVYNSPVMRGRAMAIFMAATTFGPVLGPMISGFVSTVTWRWTFWAGLILAGATWIPLLFLPETYGPIIIKHRAEKMRKSSGKPNVFAPIELETKGFSQLMTVTLTRPIRMFINEALVFFTCIYLSFAYAIFYLFFEAYPIIFQEMYNMKAGIAGLAFLPIGVGALVACAVFFFWDSFLYKAKKANAPWAFIEENRRLPLACIGGPLYVVSLFWLGWAATPTTHWIVPMLAGVPFGIGFLLVFIALLNYLTDAYEVFAASAMAAASCCRSIFGAALPFAAHPMYDRLGIHWATSLVAFLSLAMCIIPFAFIKYGDQIRDNSLFCRYLKETREREGKEQESQQLGQEK